MLVGVGKTESTGTFALSGRLRMGTWALSDKREGAGEEQLGTVRIFHRLGETAGPPL